MYALRTDVNSKNILAVEKEGEGLRKRDEVAGLL